MRDLSGLFPGNPQPQGSHANVGDSQICRRDAEHPAAKSAAWNRPLAAQDEARRLIAACSPHLRPLVMFLLHTGARIGEALWLDWRCVDLARAHVTFAMTKNGDPRGVPLHRELVAELANLPHRNGEVFRRPDGKPYERAGGDYDRSGGSAIKTAFKAALRRAGVKGFRVHDCRHTWATWHYAEHHDFALPDSAKGPRPCGRRDR